MSHKPLDTDARELAEDAAEWLSVLENASSEDRTVFVAWLKKSPRHVEEILRMMELDAALSTLLPRKSGPTVEPRRYAVRRYLKLHGAKEPSGPPRNELDTNRRAIIQVLLQRHIDRDAAEDLFQELWLQALEDCSVEILTDPNRLSRYLYRAACERAVAFRRGELSWVGNHSPSPTGLWDVQEPSAIEEKLGHRQLARCARDLLFRAPVSPDRRVLECFFLHPEPDRGARRRLNLTEVELGQVLWRARQLFGEIIRERGVSLSDPEVQYVREVQTAALYVANSLASKTEERDFELQMMWSPVCAAEVDVWRALKRGMVQAERSGEKVAC